MQSKKGQTLYFAEDIQITRKSEAKLIIVRYKQICQASENIVVNGW